MDSLGNIWKHIYLGPRNCSALRLLIIVHYTNSLTYLLTYMKQQWQMQQTNASIHIHTPGS